jgi:hypothetical protein
MELVSIIKNETNLLYDNIRITLNAFSEEELDNVFSNMPIWKHLYHMLHSLDQWYINPFRYEEPEFHKENMNSLFINSKPFERISRAELINYFESVKIKNDLFLNKLKEEELMEKPADCKYTRMDLILNQNRHVMYHVGSLHGYLDITTGKWPDYFGVSALVADEGSRL